MPDTNPDAVSDDDNGIGGDEPFCEHGNLLWAEHCDECIAADWKLSDEISSHD